MTPPDSGKWCKDCLSVAEGSDADPTAWAKNRRPTPWPGPRCTTHHRLRRKTASAGRHGVYVFKTYGITADQYWLLYEAQGGRCAICQRASGKARRLSVDHDHKTLLVRGLLCKPCNRDVLGHLRDSVMALARAIRYLLAPPAFRTIGRIKAPTPEEEDE